MWTRLFDRLKTKPVVDAPKVHDFTYQHPGHTLELVKRLEDGSVFLNGDSVRVGVGDVVVTKGRDWSVDRFRLIKVKLFPNGTWRAYARSERPVTQRGPGRPHRSAPASTLRPAPRRSG